MARRILTVPLKSAASPQPQRYASGKPPVPASIEQRPADEGMLSDGTTGGNYTAPNVNVGPGTGPQITDKDE